MKKCNKCLIVKEDYEFRKNIQKGRYIGLRYACRECDRKDKNLWYLNNPDKVKAYSKKYIKEHPEMIVYRKKFYEDNKKEIIEKTNKYNKERDFGLFSTYWSMKRRCEYPSQQKYKYYGGKGIRVEWKTYKDFKKDMYDSFLLHLKKYGRRQTTIDRIDSDKNYCFSNCRWATYKEQIKNRKLKSG